jgi:hypothetical protein
MAKQKTVTHLPATPTPRLAHQLVTAAGEMVILAACVLGFVTAASWLIAGYELRTRSTPTRPPRPTEWVVCRLDRHFGEMCQTDRPPPVRRHYARDGY